MIAHALVKSLYEDGRLDEHQVAAFAEAAKFDETNAAIAALANVPVALPALTRALKLQEKASSVGFDWNDPRAVLTKIREEADEIEHALANGNKHEVASEIGDLLFAAVNLARHAGADPEATLRKTNAKFERRFRFIEAQLAAIGRNPAESSLEEMDRLWDAAKAAERAS